MPEGFGPKIVGEIAGIQIADSVVVTWLIMIVLTAFSIVVTRKFDKIPKGVQNVVELGVESVNKLTVDTMGKDKKGFAPYIGTVFLFLIVANLIGLLDLRPPTADINTTFALAILTFVMTIGFGIKSKGLKKYLKSFFEPLPLLVPLNVIGELANPVSLAFRLFGNIIGGVIIMSLAYGGLASLSSAIGLGDIAIFQVGIPIVLHAYFDIFSGLLQSFIFVMLTMVFISGAMD